METIILVLVFTLILSVSNVACFFIGAKTVQNVLNGKKIDIPKAPNPIEVVKKHKEKKETEYELNRQAIIIENFENYDGTSYGQKDVPEARD